MEKLQALKRSGGAQVQQLQKFLRPGAGIEVKNPGSSRGFMGDPWGFIGGSERGIMGNIGESMGKIMNSLNHPQNVNVNSA